MATFRITASVLNFGNMDFNEKNTENDKDSLCKFIIQSDRS
jgi:hypothetical protein